MQVPLAVLKTWPAGQRQHWPETSSLQESVPGATQTPARLAAVPLVQAVQVPVEQPEQLGVMVEQSWQLAPPLVGPNPWAQVVQAPSTQPVQLGSMALQAPQVPFLKPNPELQLAHSTLAPFELTSHFAQLAKTVPQAAVGC